MRDHNSLFDDNGNFDMVNSHVKSVMGAMVIGAISASAFAVYAWLKAPMVGGEFWPYIRFLVALVAGGVGFPVGSMVGYIIGFIGTIISKRLF